jgi:hypothetical protein
MLKRTLSIVFSAALLAGATIIILPVERAAAEMATTKEKTKKKSDDKSGMSFNDRRKKCSAEWKEAKAAGKTSGLKWPKFWSDCNKRLKQGA